MELEDAEDEIYCVNVLREDEEDEADAPKTGSVTEMERELAETEATIDSSIRRRAKRAGVEVPTPEDMIMSEAERD
jgi:hypothetical protein